MHSVKGLRSLVGFALGFVVLLPLAAGADTIHLSTTFGATLGGLAFRNGDVVEYDTDADVSTLFFNQDNFTGAPNINALHVIDAQTILLSTSTSDTLGGLSFDPGDVISYDIAADTATLFFDGSLFSDVENVDAASLLSNGDIVLSTTGDAVLGGLSFRDGDLVQYNLATDTATLLFDEDLFGADQDIDAASVLNDGRIVLSTIDTATLGGLTFLDGDLALYNPVTDTAVLYFDESLFSADEDINGISVVPEPSTGLLLGLGLAGLAAARRRAGAKIRG